MKTIRHKKPGCFLPAFMFPRLTEGRLEGALHAAGAPLFSLKPINMETQRECYRALMECRTRHEFNHVVAKYEDLIMSSEWLKMSVKSTLKRLTAVLSIKDVMAWQS